MGLVRASEINIFEEEKGHQQDLAVKEYSNVNMMMQKDQIELSDQEQIQLNEQAEDSEAKKLEGLIMEEQKLEEQIIKDGGQDILETDGAFDYDKLEVKPFSLEDYAEVNSRYMTGELLINVKATAVIMAVIQKLAIIMRNRVDELLKYPEP